MTRSGLVVVDYGAGNLVSIRNALELLGGPPTIATTEDDIAGASVIVVPGVGASGPAMERMERMGLADPIREAIRDGAWYVGICLGMQLLFERSDEDGAQMLGLLEGDVVAIADAPRLPHIGWNQLEVQRPHALLDGVADGAPAYFVHSYVARPADASIVITETQHGTRFPSIIVSDRVIGYQFHPERSGSDGLQLLRNMLHLTGLVPVADGAASRTQALSAGVS